MNFSKVISLVLALLMVFINSNFAFAKQEYECNAQKNDTCEEDVSDNINNKSIIPPNNIDISNYNGCIKPSNNLYEDGDDIYQKDEFATYYFYNMTNNFGNNTHGSCGYTAVSMLLSFYDTYWDDNIIDEQYDEIGIMSSDYKLSNIESSPGIEKEPEELKNLNSGEYWNFITNNYSQYFQLYLIKLAEERFNMYHNTISILEEMGIVWNIDIDNPCASALIHQLSVIDHYLYTVKGYTRDDIELIYECTNVRDFAISKIKNGEPVLLFLGSESGFHFVLAYDWDNKGTEDTSDDDIYAHYGWDYVIDAEGNVKDAVHINIDTDEYPLLVSALALNFKDTPHSCSNNYVDTNRDEYCSCFFSVHTNHECTIFEKIDDECHQNLCECDLDSDVLEHNFVYGYPTMRHHFVYCDVCNYRKEQEVHHFEYTTNNDNTHTLSCLDCGFMISEEHDYVTHNHCYEKCTDCENVRRVVEHNYTYDYVSKNNLEHYGYCICGSRDVFEHDLYETNGHVKCYDCTYLIEANHVHSYVYTPISNGRSHTKTCRCGISKTEMCIGSIAIDGTSRCTKCGQTLPSFPELLSVDEEEDAMIYKDDEDYTCCE